MQLAAEGLAIGDHLREFMPADGFAKRCLRTEGDGIEIIFDFEDGLLCVPDEPEDDGIDVDRDSVAGERGLRRDAADAHALVYVGAQRLKDRNDEEDARPPQTNIVTYSKKRYFFPLPDDLDCEEKVKPEQNTDDERRGVMQDGA